MKSIARFDKIHYLLISLCCLLSIVSCGDDEFLQPTTFDPELTVSVVANDPVSKGIITAGFLEDKSEIGVAFYNADEGAQIGVNYNYPNTKFTAAGVAENQVWNPEQPIYLGETVGTAYAYYPYNESVTNVEEIPVTTVGQTDYLYAKQENLSSAATSATFPMNHGLAVISLKVVRGSYPGVGLLSKAEVRGPGICTAGKLNAKTGELHSFVGKAYPVAVASDVTIDPEGDIVDLIVVPNCETGAFRITLTIDGVEYITATSEIKLEAGCRYHYTVTANERQVVLSTVSIGDWGYNDAGDPTILVGGYSITLAGDLTGLAFNSVVSGSTVTIEARPKTAFWVPVSITASEGVTMTQQVASDGLITLNLSEISANLVVMFVGYKVDLVKSYENCVISKPEINSSNVISFDVAPITNFWVPNISRSGSGTLSQSIASDGKVAVTLSGVSSNTTVTIGGYSITYASGASDYIFQESINSSKVVTIKVIPTINVGSADLFVPSITKTGTATMSASSLANNMFNIQLSSVTSNIALSLNGYKVTREGNVPGENISASSANNVSTWVVNCPYTLGTNDYWVPYVTHTGFSDISTTLTSETQYKTTLTSVTANESLSLNGYKVTREGNVPTENITPSFANGVGTWVVNCPYTLGTNEHWVPYVTHSGTSSISTAITTDDKQYQTVLSNIRSNETLTLNGYKISAGGDMSNLTVTSSNNNGVVTYTATSNSINGVPRVPSTSLFPSCTYAYTTNSIGRSATLVFSNLTENISIPFSGVNTFVWSVQFGTWNNTSSSSSIDGSYYTCVSPGTNSSTVIRCTFSGVSSITFSFRGQGESGCDFLTVGNIDTNCTRSNYAVLVDKSSSWSTKTYTCDAGEHYVEFCYSKDGSVDKAPDNAEVFISAVTY